METKFSSTLDEFERVGAHLASLKEQLDALNEASQVLETGLQRARESIGASIVILATQQSLEQLVENLRSNLLTPMQNSERGIFPGLLSIFLFVCSFSLLMISFL